MAAAAAAAAGGVRDIWGFPIKSEFQELYQRFAPIYEAEEAERSQRWDEFLAELEGVVPSLPDEEPAALLRRALDHLAAAAEAGDAPPHAAQLLQRLAALVQAGLPMAKRGAFWRLFLGVDAKRSHGEYRRLVAEVERLESGGGGGSRGSGSGEAAGCGTPPPAGAAGLAAAAAAGAAEPCYHALPSVYHLVADARGAAAQAAAASHAAPAVAASQQQQQQHGQQQQQQQGQQGQWRPRVDTFSITALDEDEEHVGEGTPPRAGCAAGGDTAAAALATLTPLGVSDELPAAALTPASTLQTPQSTSSSGGSGGKAAPGGAAAGASSPACAAAGPPAPAAAADTAERWRQQDVLAQIDKDLHRTFPGHPAMDAAGRATLRRILAAFARRNRSIGYCQGLNFLGATLLLFMDEENAFWALCALVEDLLGRGYFDERMVPVQVDVLVFGHLLQGRFPTLWSHLQALEVDAASVTIASWFICCFLNSLPLDSTLRVWDQLFFERSPVVLFRVALALVEIYDQALMCTRESSEAYLLLQCCAQMTFDAGRLVDTAACGYAHLRPAGLAALRQRYRPEVMESLRGVFPSEDEYDMYVTTGTGSDNDSSASGGSGQPGGSGAPAPFAETFRRASEALLAAEEAAARLRHPGDGMRQGGDGGHLSLARLHAGGSQRSSPGAASTGGSVPASPLARVGQAVRGLTTRLMPSSLPSLLPAGAVDAAGRELDVASGGGRAAPAFRRATTSASPARQPAGGAERKPPPLRFVSTSGSPTVGGSGSGGSAALGRHGGDARITPFSEVASLEALLAEAELQQRQQRQQQQEGAWTPQRATLPAPAAGVPQPGPWVQSQPATPAEAPAFRPSPGARRVFTAGYVVDSQAAGHSRRRARRLTLDLLSLANLRPDLQQPAVAAAFAIAANPSPRAAGARSGSSWQLSAPAASPLGPGGSAGTPGSAAAAAGSAAEELVLPIRALRFEEQGQGGPTEEDSSDGTHHVRRAATAPPAVLLGPGACSLAGASAAESQPPPAEQALRRHTTEDASLAAAAAVAAASSLVSLKRQGHSRRSSSASGAAELPLAGPACGTPVAAAAAAASPSPGRRPQHPPALLAMAAQLQEEVAVAESRRHDAEQAAAAAVQTASDLRQQLCKVERQVADKTALVGELSQRLQACAATLAELDGEIAARQLAVEAEEAAEEARRRASAAADALIRRLMDAVAQAGRSQSSGAPSGASSGSAFDASSARSGGGSDSDSAGRQGSGDSQLAGDYFTASSSSPQSSSGSVAVRASPPR